MTDRQVADGARITNHWRDRVRERIGPDADPAAIWAGILWAIVQRRTDLVEFVARVDRADVRVFKFRTDDGRYWFALVNTADMVPITVYADGWLIRREGRSSQRLKGEPDIWKRKELGL